MFERSISFGRYGQWVAAIAATFSGVISGIIMAWPTAAFPKMEEGTAGVNFTEAEKSWLASLPFLSAMLTAIPVSYIMDIIGRRMTLHCSMVLAMINWIILAFSDNIYLLYLARVMSGLFCGIEFISVAIYVAEIVEPTVRGKLISVTGMMFYLGPLLVSLVSYTSYLTMNLLCGFPTLLLLITFFFIPESPYYYIMQGKRKEAEDALKWLRGKCDMNEINRIEEGVSMQIKNRGTYKGIIAFKPNRKAFFLIEFFKIFSSCTASLILFSYSTDLIPDSFVSSQYSFVLLCGLWVFAGFVTSSVMDAFPRRKIMAVSCIGTMFFYSITAIWFFLEEFNDTDTVRGTTWIPLMTVICGSFFEIVGIMNVPNVLKGEIFPINIKAKAGALLCVTACALETANALYYYDVNNYIGKYFHFLKAVLSASLNLYLTIFYMFETKGLTLEAIQNILIGKNPPT